MKLIRTFESRGLLTVRPHFLGHLQEAEGHQIPERQDRNELSITCFQLEIMEA